MPDDIEEITWPRRSLGRPDLTFRVRNDGSSWLLTYRRSGECAGRARLTVMRLVKSVDGAHYIGYERIVAAGENGDGGAARRHKKVAAWEVRSENDLFMVDLGLRQLVDFEELALASSFLLEARCKLRDSIGDGSRAI